MLQPAISRRATYITTLEVVLFVQVASAFVTEAKSRQLVLYWSKSCDTELLNFGLMSLTGLTAAAGTQARSLS
jgi:hypothetical protein